jgi:hypothetical protein
VKRLRWLNHLRPVLPRCATPACLFRPDTSQVAARCTQRLGFSAAGLRDDPSRALRAVVRVGSKPVGLLLVDDGCLALVANSNRGLVPGTGSGVPQAVSVINTAAALVRRPAVVGLVPTGLFPCDLPSTLQA